ncbi:multimerin-2a [Pholidichthys leucotaenia]
MTSVGALVLLLGLLLSAHGELRARDPHVEEEEELGPGGGPGSTQTGIYPARTGNWCTFVHKRTETVAVADGTKEYVMKVQSPCPNGEPGCLLDMYKVSTRPVYRQVQRIKTALLWRCCPGYGGENCEGTDVQAQQLQISDPDREQNDGAPYTSHRSNQEDATHPNQSHTHKPHQTQHYRADTYDHHHQLHHHHDNHGQVVPDQLASLPYADAHAILPAPHMMALVMSQLQPLLEAFNRSLEHLNQRMGDLSRDLDQLKSRDTDQLRHHDLDQHENPDQDENPVLDHLKSLDSRLDTVVRDVGAVQKQLEDHGAHMDRLHSQHVMLHYNLTTLKMEVDVKLKQQSKLLQVSLQAVNTTLTELRLDQDQQEGQQEEPSAPSAPPPPLSDTSALWEAVERLDNKVVTNMVTVGGLMEDVAAGSGGMEQLRRRLVELEQQVNQTARRSQVLFMETGLEVEEAKVSVLRGVDELAASLYKQVRRLDDIDEDVEYLYNAHYNRTSIAECCNCCHALRTTVAGLERGVANVTQLANENRLALEEDGGAELWAGASDWEPAVEALQRGLQQVKELVDLDQTRTRTLESVLTHLNSSTVFLEKADRRREEQVNLLSASFASLLEDTSRHSRVLEFLLGEEVLDFMEGPVRDADSLSVPALREELNLLEEQLRSHKLSVGIMKGGGHAGGREEMPPADQPSLPWLPTGGAAGVPVREHQLLLHHALDGSDLWNLERTVEALQQRVVQVEGRPCSCPNDSSSSSLKEQEEVQTEVRWLKRGLEEHLRLFKNVFSNADELEKTDATLELDKLWRLLRREDEGRRGRKKGAGEGAGKKRRSRREAPGAAVPADQSDISLLFVGFPVGVSDAVFTFVPSLNHRGFYSDVTSAFSAPQDGVYLFVLTVDLRPGPAHLLLSRTRRGRSLEKEGGRTSVTLYQEEVAEAGPVSGAALLLLREGEEAGLELRAGEWAESQENLFAALLLHPIT